MSIDDFYFKWYLCGTYRFESEGQTKGDAMPTRKITKDAVDKLSLPESGQVDYFDTKLKGFGVRVSATSKTYFVLRRVNGKKVRVTIGRHGEFTADRARKEAEILFPDMRKGENPNQKKREAKIKGATLQEVFDDYLSRRKLKPRTVENYKDLFRLYLSDWMKKPVIEITRDMVDRRHGEIAKGERGRKVYRREVKREEKDGKQSTTVEKVEAKDVRKEAAADNVMRTLRAVLNFALAGEEEDGKVRVNPVSILSRKKAWYKVAGRRSLIKKTELPRWHKAVMGLDNPHTRDFLRFLLFTGLRRREAARLEWRNVDFEERTFCVPDTKNKTPHTLPMSDYVHDLLLERYENQRQNGYVFPGDGEHGHIQEPKRAIDAVTAETGIIFSCHDLRRTFETIAESLDLSKYTLKALINHKQDRNDVTAGYIVLDVERLREPMQRVSEEIKKAIEAGAAKVIPLSNSKRKQAGKSS